MEGDLDITFTAENGDEFETTFEHVAGRGSPGNINWGVGDGVNDPADLEDARDLLTERVDEPVLLTGGGGPGYDLAILDGINIEEYRDGYKLRAELTLVAGKLSGSGRRGDTFTPWIDSWQLNVLEDAEAAGRVTEWADAYLDAYA